MTRMTMRLGVTPQGTRVARNVGIPLAFSLVASLVGFYVISSVWSSCDSQPNENVSFLFAATVGGPAIFFTSILVLSIASTLLRNATARLYYPAITSLAIAVLWLILSLAVPVTPPDPVAAERCPSGVPDWWPWYIPVARS